MTFDGRDGEREEPVFDAKRYRYLGQRSIWIGEGDASPCGTPISDSALISTKVAESRPLTATVMGRDHPGPAP
ncbi:hypothetical protein [Actinomadura formosensis]|uniref:hypothetical protein n=1 Tax=Actinomadura formosensis TaxID=60706 RepID=UPI003D8CEC11